jgi:hypothetical protein
VNHPPRPRIGQDLRAPKVSQWHKTGKGDWTKKTWYELVADERVRKIHLPIPFLGRNLRGEAFVLGSMVSWCVSKKSRTFNPTIDQIAARAGFGRRATQQYLAKIARSEKSPIKRSSSRGRRTTTEIAEGLSEWKRRTNYLEIPVAALWYVSCGKVHVGLLARCVLAAILNRATLAGRLVESSDYEPDVDQNLTITAIGRKTHIRPVRIREAIWDLQVCGVPVSIHTENRLEYDWSQEIGIPCCHDTLIDWKHYSHDTKKS